MWPVPGDLLVAVCDSAYEEIGGGPGRVALVGARPGADGTAAAFERAFGELADRVDHPGRAPTRRRAASPRPGMPTGTDQAAGQFVVELLDRPLVGSGRREPAGEATAHVAVGGEMEGRAHGAGRCPGVLGCG
jgi:hypothetical protein